LVQSCQPRTPQGTLGRIKLDIRTQQHRREWHSGNDSTSRKVANTYGATTSGERPIKDGRASQQTTAVSRCSCRIEISIRVNTLTAFLHSKRYGASPTGDTRSDVGDRLLQAVASALERGVQLKRWWERTDAASAYQERFELTRDFNESDRSFGFLDVAAIDGESVPVMGDVEERVFDHPKSSATELYRRQLREFVLRYLMRVSDFRPPAAYVSTSSPRSHASLPFSLCPTGAAQDQGFGYSQWFYKSARTGEIGQFDAGSRFQIVDLRELGETYEWIVVRVKIFNFTMTLRPFGDEAPQAVVPLNEWSYLVLSRDFIQDDSRPAVDRDGCRTVGRYGFGYAYVKSPQGGILAYGPGEFDVAFQLINFRIAENGQTRVCLAFTANRPVHIAEMPVLPIDWPLRLANAATVGLGAPLLIPLSNALSRLASPAGRFDPVTTLVDLANLLTAGQAAARFCISRDQLERVFLLKHFKQHYDMVSGALLTWRLIDDWSNEATLPDWVRKGVRT
jgi:hypothetical protein